MRLSHVIVYGPTLLSGQMLHQSSFYLGDASELKKRFTIALTAMLFATLSMADSTLREGASLSSHYPSPPATTSTMRMYNSLISVQSMQVTSPASLIDTFRIDLPLVSNLGGGGNHLRVVGNTFLGLSADAAASTLRIILSAEPLTPSPTDSSDDENSIADAFLTTDVLSTTDASVRLPSGLDVWGNTFTGGPTFISYGRVDGSVPIFLSVVGNKYGGASKFRITDETPSATYLSPTYDAFTGAVAGQSACNVDASDGVTAVGLTISPSASAAVIAAPLPCVDSKLVMTALCGAGTSYSAAAFPTVPLPSIPTVTLGGGRDAPRTAIPPCFGLARYHSAFVQYTDAYHVVTPKVIPLDEYVMLSEGGGGGGGCAPILRRPVNLSSTFTLTQTPSFSQSETVSVSKSESASISESISASASLSLSISESASVSVSASGSVSLSVSASESGETPSRSRSILQSDSLTSQETPTATASSTIVPTPSKSIVETDTASDTFSGSLSQSVEPPPTRTETSTPTFNATPSMTQNSTATLTPSLTIDPPATGTATVSLNDTASQSVKATESFTNTLSASENATASQSENTTLSREVSPTQTLDPTATDEITLTGAQRRRLTDTLSESLSFTDGGANQSTSLTHNASGSDSFSESSSPSRASVSDSDPTPSLSEPTPSASKPTLSPSKPTLSLSEPTPSDSQSESQPTPTVSKPTPSVSHPTPSLSQSEPSPSDPTRSGSRPTASESDRTPSLSANQTETASGAESESASATLSLPNSENRTVTLEPTASDSPTSSATRSHSVANSDTPSRPLTVSGDSATLSLSGPSETRTPSVIPTYCPMATLASPLQPLDATFLSNQVFNFTLAHDDASDDNSWRTSGVTITIHARASSSDSSAFLASSVVESSSSSSSSGLLTTSSALSSASASFTSRDPMGWDFTVSLEEMQCDVVTHTTLACHLPPQVRYDISRSESIVVTVSAASYENPCYYRDQHRLQLAGDGDEVRQIAGYIHLYKPTPSIISQAVDVIGTFTGIAAGPLVGIILGDPTSIEVQLIALVLGSDCASPEENASSRIIVYFLSPFWKLGGSPHVIVWHTVIVVVVVLLHLALGWILKKCYFDEEEENTDENTADIDDDAQVVEEERKKAMVSEDDSTDITSEDIITHEEDDGVAEGGNDEERRQAIPQPGTAQVTTKSPKSSPTYASPSRASSSSASSITYLSVLYRIYFPAVPFIVAQLLYLGVCYATFDLLLRRESDASSSSSSSSSIFYDKGRRMNSRSMGGVGATDALSEGDDEGDVFSSRAAEMGIAVLGLAYIIIVPLIAVVALWRSGCVGPRRSAADAGNTANHHHHRIADASSSEGKGEDTQKREESAKEEATAGEESIAALTFPYRGFLAKPIVLRWLYPRNVYVSADAWARRYADDDHSIRYGDHPNSNANSQEAKGRRRSQRIDIHRQVIVSMSTIAALFGGDADDDDIVASAIENNNGNTKTTAETNASAPAKYIDVDFRDVSDNEEDNEGEAGEPKRKKSDKGNANSDDDTYSHLGAQKMSPVASSSLPSAPPRPSTQQNLVTLTLPLHHRRVAGEGGVSCYTASQFEANVRLRRGWGAICMLMRGVDERKTKKKDVPNGTHEEHNTSTDANNADESVQSNSNVPSRIVPSPPTLLPPADLLSSPSMIRYFSIYTNIVSVAVCVLSHAVPQSFRCNDRWLSLSIVYFLTALLLFAIRPHRAIIVSVVTGVFYFVLGVLTILETLSILSPSVSLHDAKLILVLVLIVIVLARSILLALTVYWEHCELKQIEVVLHSEDGEEEEDDADDACNATQLKSSDAAHDANAIALDTDNNNNMNVDDGAVVSPPLAPPAASSSSSSSSSLVVEKLPISATPTIAMTVSSAATIGLEEEVAEHHDGENDGHRSRLPQPLLLTRAAAAGGVVAGAVGASGAMTTSSSASSSSHDGHHHSSNAAATSSAANHNHHHDDSMVMIDLIGPSTVLDTARATAAAAAAGEDEDDDDAVIYADEDTHKEEEEAVWGAVVEQFNHETEAVSIGDDGDDAAGDDKMANHDAKRAEVSPSPTLSARGGGATENAAPQSNQSNAADVAPIIASPAASSTYSFSSSSSASVVPSAAAAVLPPYPLSNSEGSRKDLQAKVSSMKDADADDDTDVIDVGAVPRPDHEDDGHFVLADENDTASVVDDDDKGAAHHSLTHNQAQQQQQHRQRIGGRGKDGEQGSSSSSFSSESDGGDDEDDEVYSRRSSLGLDDAHDNENNFY